ncbi:UNVERIFIED_CONTAM: hypothetical protein FKN15_061587 [Acipenser sinensis]
MVILREGECPGLTAEVIQALRSQNVRTELFTMVILREGECPGLTAEVIQALRSQNVRTVVDLVSSDTEELARKCALSYKTLVAVKRVLLAQYTAFPTNGADLYEELLSSTAILSTGNPSLDKLLDSGLYTGEVTELIGAPGSGKTQVCLGVAVSVACVLKRTVLYIDSTGGLSASRLLQMVQSKACKMEEHMEALRRIQVRQVFSVFSLIEALQDLRSSGFHQVAGGSGSVKVVIVDSVAAVLSPIIGGRQTEGLSLMMQLAGELRTMARDLGVAVLLQIGPPSLNFSLTETLSVPEENSPPSSVGLNDIIPTHELTLVSKPDLQSTLLRSSQQPAIQQAFLQPRNRNTGVQPQPISVAKPFYSIVQQGQYCDDKVDVKGGTIQWPEERSSGSVLKYICPVGTYAYPVNWSVCVRGRWTLLRNAYGDRDTVVTCKPVTCVSPFAPEFGALTPRHHVFRWNDTIEFSCYSGFVLLGSAQSTCQVNGRWSGKLPVCDHKDNFCSNPGVPFGGSRSGDFFEEGSVVKYTCDSKLVLRGSSERKCLLTGVWSGEEPQCQSMRGTLSVYCYKDDTLIFTHTHSALVQASKHTLEKKP